VRPRGSSAGHSDSRTNSPAEVTGEIVPIIAIPHHCQDLLGCRDQKFRRHRLQIGSLGCEGSRRDPQIVFPPRAKEARWRVDSGAGSVVWLGVILEHGVFFIRQPEHAVEFALPPLSRKQAFGFQPLKVGQVADGGEPERFQENSSW
jgi:hypothetical protein